MNSLIELICTSFPLAHVEPEKYNVSIFHHVVLPFLDVLPLSLHCVLVSVVHQVLILHYLGADEALLEIGVDHSCRLRGLSQTTDGPAPHLVGSCRKVVDQIQGVVA
jgi:hypothetical protein